MELTAVAIATEPALPGSSEPADAAAEVFAALLAALMGAPAPVPEALDEVAPPAQPGPEPEGAEVVAALTGERAAYPALAPIASAPLGGTPAPEAADEGEPLDVPEAAVQADAPEVKAAPPAAHAPTRAVSTDVAVRAPDAIPLPAVAAAPVAPAPVADAPVPELAPQPPATSSPAPIRLERPEIVQAPPAPAPVQPTPVEQVVRVVTPLRRLGDGQHDLVLELRPADLGAVRVELSLDKGVVHLGLRAEVEQTGQLLRAALPDLRQQLDAAGVLAGRVAVDAGDAGAGGRQWRTVPDGLPGGRHRGEALPEDDEPTTTAYSSSSAYGHVDVLL